MGWGVSVQAAACGNIVAPAHWREGADSSDPSVTTPLEDCTNPFGVTPEDANPYSLYIEGNKVENQSVVTLDSGATTYYYHRGNVSPTVQKHFTLFRHDGADFRYVNTEPTEPDEAFYREYAATYFEPGLDYEPVIQAILDESFYIPDNEELDSRVYSFYSEAWYHYAEHRRPVLSEGTYTAVFTETSIIMIGQAETETQRSSLLAWLLPIAHAAEPGSRTFTVTFTIAKPIPEPAGASSVLFLPGIQASRLYTDGLLGTEDMLWEPNINDDVAQLAMAENGTSVNDIYTRDVVNEIFGVLNVYKTFLSMLEDMKEREEIKDFLPFPYDWRYDVQDLVVSGTKYDTGVKSAIDEIEKLAADSYSNRVTIVAHSNGGLFAKALMIELEGRNIAHLIDKVVFIGTPQLGTPKAIGAILHGYGQKYGGGFISDDATARDVIRNMPGAYALLPSDAYFEEVGGTVVTNDDKPQTTYLDSYNNIDTYAKLVDFMTDAQDTRGDDVSIQVPNTSNAALLQKARDLHRELDSWIAPSSTQVFEIAGVGIATIKAFEYKSFPCSVDVVGLLCLGGGYSKPSPVTTVYGDETVVATSAVAYKGDKFTAYVDLQEEGEELFISQREHSNLTESNTVKDYVSSILKFGYQSESLNIPEDYIEVKRRYTIAGVHSPVDILVIDGVGRKLGIELGAYYQEISGAQYIELADSRYVILPAGEYEIILSGYATGTYSVTLETLSGETTETFGGIFGASTSPSMRGSFDIDDGEVGRLSIDMNGDDTEDYSADLETGLIAVSTTTPVIDVTDGTKKSSGTRVGKLPRPQVAGISLSKEEEYYQKAFELLTLLQRYLELIKNKHE